MTTQSESTDCKVESSERQPSNDQPSKVDSRPSWSGAASKIPHFLFICIVLSTSFCAAEVWGEVPGRVTYRDGSPCAFCWLQVQLEDRSLKMRVDGEGYFKLAIETPEQIMRMTARKLRGERIVEDGFLFLLLRKNNPQLEPVIKDLRKRLQTYQVFAGSALIQQVVSENCYFQVERELTLFDRVSRFRSVEVDLSQLEVVELCSDDERACIRLQPARVLGERHRLDLDGAVILFDARHREETPGVLHSIALLARACGNLKAQVIAPETPPPARVGQATDSLLR